MKIVLKFDGVLSEMYAFSVSANRRNANESFPSFAVTTNFEDVFFAKKESKLRGGNAEISMK